MRTVSPAVIYDRLDPWIANPQRLHTYSSDHNAKDLNALFRALERRGLSPNFQNFVDPLFDGSYQFNKVPDSLRDLVIIAFPTRVHKRSCDSKMFPPADKLLTH